MTCLVERVSVVEEGDTEATIDGHGIDTVVSHSSFGGIASNQWLLLTMVMVVVCC